MKFTTRGIDRSKDCSQGDSECLTFLVTFGGFEINTSGKHLHFSDISHMYMK